MTSARVLARLAFAATALFAVACGGGSPDAPEWTRYSAKPDALARHPRLAQPDTKSEPCAITVDTPPLLDAFHVPLDSVVDYSSNPPSSGPHFPVWARYGVHEGALPRPVYVHNLEHGAVVLLHQCTAGEECDKTTAFLESIVDAMPTDTGFRCLREAVRVRAVVTADPLIDAPVAAAAWGWTYKASCLDAASLTAFVRAHYAQGEEVDCTDGSVD